jgi:hypothetical protein
MDHLRAGREEVMSNSQDPRDRIRARYRWRWESITRGLAISAYTFAVLLLVVYIVLWSCGAPSSYFCDFVPLFTLLVILFTIGTPTWFFLEYYYIVDHTKSDMDASRYAHFRHGQTLAAAVWAAFSVVLFVSINHGFDICKAPGTGVGG